MSKNFSAPTHLYLDIPKSKENYCKILSKLPLNKLFQVSIIFNFEVSFDYLSFVLTKLSSIPVINLTFNKNPLLKKLGVIKAGNVRSVFVNYSTLNKNLLANLYRIFAGKDIEFAAIFYLVKGVRISDIKRAIHTCERYGLKYFNIINFPIDPIYGKFCGCTFIKKVNDFSKNYDGNIIIRNDSMKLFYAKRLRQTKTEYIGCPAALTFAYADSNGFVRPCPYAPAYPKSLIEEKFSKIWFSEYFSNLRNRRLYGKCGRCKYKIGCGGCRVLALIKNKNIYFEDPLCNIA